MQISTKAFYRSKHSYYELGMAVVRHPEDGFAAFLHLLPLSVLLALRGGGGSVPV